MLYSLGAQDRLVGVTDVCVFPEQVLKDRESGKVRVVGVFSNPDLAAIDALHPDLILTSTGFQKPLAERLRQKGYTVIHFEPRRLSDILDEIEQVASAVGKTA